MAAIPYVHGDIMITMDDDGQHPAEGIFVCGKDPRGI